MNNDKGQQHNIYIADYYNITLFMHTQPGVYLRALIKLQLYKPQMASSHEYVISITWHILSCYECNVHLYIMQWSV